ncbi:MAG: adenylate/guanylate cyclase domain-containing protein [Caldimonas sp.]
MPCARCDADNPAGARFCSACGAGLQAACPHCGAVLQGGQRFCNGCGHEIVAAPPSAAELGERRHATVMFSDLTGYTALNEAADPEEVEAIMGRIKAEAATVIERHGGTVNQFVGDEIMALFGVPLARRDDPRRAVAAALELHDAVARLVAELEPGPGRPALSMHTGINTGLVVARRSDARAGDYALTGDAVNVAARLCSLAGPGEVLVGADTWQQVSDHFEAEAGAPVEVKGKERPLSPYRIRGARAAPVAGAGPLVGREEELRDFAALAAACAERQRSRVVVVRGDPGVGKSRLVAEFAAKARTLGFSCHAAAVLDFGAQTGRDAVRSLARSLLGVAGTAEEAERRAAIEAAAAARPIALDRQLFLCDLLDVTPPPALLALAAAMSTAAREQGSLHAVCDLATAAAAAAPLLLVVEDIHWADAWTLERLAALALLAARQPLLLVMTTRFAGDPTAGAWRTVLHGAPLIGIDLGPLNAEEASRLATHASSMPAAVVASCVERAEGNPLFLLQLLLNAGEAAQSSLPGSIQALVHARMDRLAGDDKTALQAAAVLGQRFAADALRHLLDKPGYDSRLLVENFLVRADGSEFMFCHALIRDGAYESLLHKRRRALHARAAEWFESRDLVLAAEHFDRAEDPRAAPAYLAAGNSVAAQFRHAAALALIERGLSLAAAHEIRFALLMARGRLMLELGRSAEAIEACRAALDASASPGERAQALIASAAGMRLNDRIAEGLAALDEAEPLAAGAALALELSRLHHLRGNLLFPLGRHADCLREHELARRFAREAGSLEAEAAALGGLGDAFYLQGRMRSAHQQFLECVALARKHGFGRLEVANLPMVGWSGMHLAEIGAAVAVGHEAIELAQRASQPRAELMGRTLVAWSDGLVRDRRDDAELQIEAALRLVRALGAKRFEGQLHALGALIALRRGDRQRALELADTGVAVCLEHGTGHIGPWVHGVRALAETDPQVRVQFLQEGERLLALGCVSHNHIQLRELAIDALLEIGDWDAVELNCERIRAYTAAEPLPMSEFLITRGRVLARFGRGERGADVRAALVELREVATRAEWNSALPAIESALAGDARFETVSGSR